MVSKELRRGVVGLALVVVAATVFALSVFAWWPGTPTTLVNFAGLLAILPTAWILRSAPELETPRWMQRLVKLGLVVVLLSAVFMGLAMAAGIHWTAVPLFFMGFLAVLLVGIAFALAVVRETLPQIATALDREVLHRWLDLGSKSVLGGLGLLVFVVGWNGYGPFSLGAAGRLLGLLVGALVFTGLALFNACLMDLLYHVGADRTEPVGDEAPASL